MRSEVDEIGNGNDTVAIEVAVGPSGVGFVEIGAEGDEIRNGDRFIEIQVANQRVKDQDFTAVKARFAGESAINRAGIADGAKAPARQIHSAAKTARANVAGDVGDAA